MSHSRYSIADCVGHCRGGTNGRANFLVFAGVAEDPEVQASPRCNSRRSAATINTIRRSTASTIATAASSAAEWWSS